MNKYIKLLIFGALLTSAIKMSHAQTTFQSGIDIASNVVSGISTMDVGDINQDGYGDIVVIEGGKHASNNKTFAWYQAPSTINGNWIRHEFNNDSQLRSFLGAAKLADMDNDGDLDLVVSSDNHSGSTKEADVYIYINPGASLVTGSWVFEQVTATTQALHHINDMEINDLDGDGKLDVVVRSLEPNQIHIFFQDAINSYTQKIINTDIVDSEGLGVGFLDSDNLPDITYTGYWLKSPINPRTQNYTKLNIDNNYHTINQNTKEAIGDIDGDGLNDVVISPAEAFRDGQNTSLSWYKNPGNTTVANWQKHDVETLTNNMHTVKLGDMDNDNDLDIIVGIPWSNNVANKSISVYYNGGNGVYGSEVIVSSNKGLYSGVVFDVDNDGDLDIIGQDTYASQSKPYVYENESNTLGISNQLFKQILVYPNPVKRYLNIKNSDLNLDYSLYSLLGKEVINSTLESNLESIDLNNLSQGVYILQLSTANGIKETYRIVKQ